jgi:hypothetical protein
MPCSPLSVCRRNSSQFFQPALTVQVSIAVIFTLPVSGGS